MSAVRNFVITLLMSLLIFGLAAYGVLQFASSAFGLGSGGGNVPSQSEDTTSDELPPPPEILEGINGESMTVLFIGTDYLPNEYNDYEYADKTPDGFDGETREIDTDTIILVRINKETGECIFCPIPAITEVKIDGHSSTLKKLYSRKGVDALCQQITVLTGLPIDFYASVTIDSLKSIINDLGGIEFYVPEDMTYLDPETQVELGLIEGLQVLNGDDALYMLRYRSYRDEDVSRRRTGSEFLKAIVKKVMTDIPLKDAAMAYMKYQSLITTNFSIDDLASHADLIFSFNKLSVKDYTYPGKTTGNGENAVFTPNIDAATKFFNGYKFKG